MDTVCQLCAPTGRLPFGSDNMHISGCAFGCAQIPGDFRYERDRYTPLLVMEWRL
jgi:hypothetical protein